MFLRVAKGNGQPHFGSSAWFHTRTVRYQLVAKRTRSITCKHTEFESVSQASVNNESLVCPVLRGDVCGRGHRQFPHAVGAVGDTAFRWVNVSAKIVEQSE